MTTVPSRRARITRVVELRELAKHIRVRVASGGPMLFPLDFAEAVDALLAAAADLERLAGQELVTLEGARDWDVHAPRARRA